LRTREWEKDGIKRYTTEIMADDMKLLGRRAESQQGASASQSSYQASQQAATPAVAPQPAAVPVANDDPDDLPF
ncbi:MAG: single-stranded DNA-binding protein, partial [Alistipes sp.]|nr:single-stranded DNA-binding protein [Alistipes sp.]